MILEVRIVNELCVHFLELRILKGITDYRALMESAAPDETPKAFSGGTRFAGTQ
jgi:hypothetical protein